MRCGAGDDLQIAQPLKPLIFQGPGGLSRKTADGSAASLYYSFTRLQTEGTITRAGKGKDPRISTYELQNEIYTTVNNASTTETLVNAAKRLVDELPEGTPSLHATAAMIVPPSTTARSAAASPFTDW